MSILRENVETTTDRSVLLKNRRFVGTKETVAYVLEDAWTDMLWMIVFGIGSINNNFMKKPIILPLMGIEEIFEMCVYGLRRVIPAEITNESMDYCEW